MPDPIVTFESVSKSYDGKIDVVKSLDLTLARGEFLTLLGPSGSGKTTTLMMLAGFEEPDARHDHARRPAPQQRAGAQARHRHGVPELRAVPAHDVAENLAFPLQMHGVPRSRDPGRASSARSRWCACGHLGDRKPAQLSGGQQQRVAVARALVFEPKLVLMDEPLGALDKQLREQMQLEIKHLHESLGVTVVYVTHDQSEALTMSDRIAVFHHGAIQQLATPTELYERPANAFVASFIGENNRLDGTARRAATATRAACGSADGTRGDCDSRRRPRRSTRDVVLSMRPERVSDRRRRSGAQPLRRAAARGSHLPRRPLQAAPRVAGSDDFIAKVPATSVAVARGDALIVSWPAQACLALPSDSKE